MFSFYVKFWTDSRTDGQIARTDRKTDRHKIPFNGLYTI